MSERSATGESKKTLGSVLSEFFYAPFLAGARIEDVEGPLHEALAGLNAQLVSLEPRGADGVRLVIIDEMGHEHEATMTRNSPTNEAVT